MPTEIATPGTAKPARKAGNGKGQGGGGTGSYLPDIHRLLPQSADAEQGTLSSILLAPKEVAGHCVEKGIRKEHFHIPAHSTIYELLLEMYDQRQPIDVITLTQTLRDRKQLDQVGGPAFVTDLFTFLPTAANAGFYIEILEEKFTLREIIRVCTEYAARSYDEQDDVTTLLDEVETRVLNISKDRYKDKIASMKDQVMAAIHAIEQKLPVAVFSLEMSASQLVQRMLCSRARVDLGNVRNGLLSERDFPALTAAASKLAESKIYIDDTAGLSILELRAKARRLKSQHGIEAIFIDYLQLLRSTSRRAQDNRQIEIAEISSGLKALSKELNIPIVVLAQLNRKPEDRSGDAKGRPRLSDLRESGSIEQDADVVALLVREEYYADTDEEKKESEGKATLIIAKQRNGPTGDVPLTFLKQFTRFETRAYVDAEE